MKRRFFLLRTLAPVLLLGLLTQCNRPSEDDGKPLVVATTTMVADLVQRIGGDDIRLEALMGPGVDPHLYRSSPSDVTKLNRAKGIFYNGLLLEGRMQDVLERLKKQGKPVFAVTDAIPKEQLLAPDDEGHPDPHVWGDAELWIHALGAVEAGLSEIVPEAAERLAERAAAYREALVELDRWATERVLAIPENKRKLVTSHDAFSYFGRAYGIEVVGVQGISTASDPSMADRTRMVDFIKQHQIAAIFVESSVSPALIEQIARDAGVRVGGQLFSDAMGQPGDMETAHGETYDLGTYTGMLKHNVNTVVEALK